MKKIVAGMLFALFALGALAIIRRVPSASIVPRQTTLAPNIAPLRYFSEDEVRILDQQIRAPSDIAFLPDGDVLLTERSGVLRDIGQHPFSIRLADVVSEGNAGLLGLALDPNFQSNGYIYLYQSTRSFSQRIHQVVRYQLSGDRIFDRTVIVDRLPASSDIVGGRIAFGPDGDLYITTGIDTNEMSAQNTSSLEGKILRVHADGTLPTDNPFGNAVYSFGHRNVQGLAWDAQGRLWATEPGSSDQASGNDELNLILKGANYGWPVIRGDEHSAGMQAPALHSGVSSVWGPSDMAFLNGSLYISGLEGEGLYEVRLTNEGHISFFQQYFRGLYGRIRSVATTPEGNMYIATSNTDGVGTPKTGDDKILMVNPRIFRGL